MSGYTPVFSSVVTGTLCGKWPDIGLWTVILSMSDKNGVVDVTCGYIAGVTGLPEDEVEACMARFCQPDPKSRSQEHSGARLVLIADDRDWGWQIVNHTKYREKARLSAKNAREVEEGRNAERLAYRRNNETTAGDRRSPPVTDPSNANAYSNKEREKAIALPDSWTYPQITGLPSDFDLSAEAKKFCAYYNSNGKLSHTWDANFEVWCRRSLDRPNGYTRKTSSSDRDSAITEGKERGFRPMMAHENATSYRTAMRMA